MDETQTDVNSTYRIGAVSRLTGIPADTLRVWERRYGVVEPLRSPKGSRLYTRSDISRLALIKRLVDAGHAIGSVAALSLEQLEERLQAQQDVDAGQPRAPASPARLAFLGDSLPALATSRAEELEPMEVVVASRSPEEFLELCAARSVDTLVLEYATVHDETLDQVGRLLRHSGARQALVVYGFARDEVVRRMASRNVLPVRAPVSIAELTHLCGQAGPAAPAQRPGTWVLDQIADAPLPARQFDNQTLVKTTNVSSTIRCECPHHLASLILSLGAFEDYSAECENRTPEDAALHAMLHAATAHARDLLEHALTQVLEHEGIEV